MCFVIPKHVVFCVLLFLVREIEGLYVVRCRVHFSALSVLSNSCYVIATVFDEKKNPDPTDPSRGAPTGGIATYQLKEVF